MKTKIINILGTALVIMIPVSAHADWSINALDDLGGTLSYAYDINNAGQVIGTYTILENDMFVQKTFITDANGKNMCDFGKSSGLDFYSTHHISGINNAGQVVGWYTNNSLVDTPFITGANGKGINNIELPFETNSYATGINESGQVIGYYNSSSGTIAYITGQNGYGLTQLESPIESGAFNFPMQINNSGQVVAYSAHAENGTPFFGIVTGTNGSGLSIIPNLEGNYSIARSINDAGQMAGGATDIEGREHATIIDFNTMDITDLGTFGAEYAQGTHINNMGQVIGHFGSYGDTPSSFLYDDGKVIDISMLDEVVSKGWENLYVSGINDSGQIIGVGYLQGSKDYTGFILSPISPVPEPATWALLLAGLGVVGFMRYNLLN